MNTPVGILALHGFTGRGGDFEALQGALAQADPTAYAWHCPDLPGHGPDPRLDCSPESVAHFVAAQRSLATRHPSPFTVLLGYSMGARAALLHATRHPSDWDALILISPNPGIEDAAERAARRESDEQLACRIEREGVPGFLGWWQRQPLIRSQDEAPERVRAAMQAGRSTHRASGLAASLRGFGQGNCPNLWPELARLQMPILILCGEHDRTYRGFAQRMKERLPSATLIPIHCAGHAPHLEGPFEAAQAVSPFLKSALGQKHP